MFISSTRIDTDTETRIVPETEKARASRVLSEYLAKNPRVTDADIARKFGTNPTFICAIRYEGMRFYSCEKGTESYKLMKEITEELDRDCIIRGTRRQQSTIGRALGIKHVMTKGRAPNKSKPKTMGTALQGIVAPVAKEQKEAAPQSVILSMAKIITEIYALPVPTAKKVTMLEQLVKY